LENSKYYNKDYKVGDKIPDELMDAMFRDDKENILVARDENGMPLNKDDMPRFEVHHKNAVKFANDDDYLAKINYPSNLVLVEHEMHRAYFHGFDHTDEVVKHNFMYFSRINMYASDVALLDGFDCSISCAWDKNVSLQKRIEKDKENVVNYYAMQLQRLNNIPEVAQKYSIEYSKNDLSSERFNMINLLQDINIDISAKDILTFSDWVEPNLKTKNQQKTNRRCRKILKKNQGNEL
jgi:hypothetical protein